ncbi:GntR family transcriptional regulator [Amycolatopsis acidicola]|uniref:GntR family transcriptional regulator n=1 Tax=Amycolatopsis acidicola TaxID=2596893 RepID=A0A5N0VDB2_9PSEU|nr:GntR family transcriptional regulator [Amycolatopsis acidicola]KAA9164055.1 GntR family transcriptional regulator [Amycolatopsis acidicola]
MVAIEKADPLVNALYSLLGNGDLAPGQRVDQRLISERLNVSRTPLREALRALAADGVLRHTPNHGYQVVRLSVEELLQYYSMRTFLETELLGSMSWPDEQQLADLTAIGAECEDAAKAKNISEMVTANRNFHFLMFSWSPLTVLMTEVVRVWRVSEAYRAVHLVDPARRRQILTDHEHMIQAIRLKDRNRLIRLMNAHRERTRQMLNDLVGSSHATVLHLPRARS